MTPQKTIYVSEGDNAIFEEAKKVSKERGEKESLSKTIVEGLKRYIQDAKVLDKAEDGFEKIHLKALSQDNNVEKVVFWGKKLSDILRPSKAVLYKSDCIAEGESQGGDHYLLPPKSCWCQFFLTKKEQILLYFEGDVKEDLQCLDGTTFSYSLQVPFLFGGYEVEPKTDFLNHKEKIPWEISITKSDTLLLSCSIELPQIDVIRVKQLLGHTGPAEKELDV